jgi:cardiolipin synthase
MLHAKTAVADGLWARVGSTNLNVTSWIGNYELDVAIEDAQFAAKMEALYEEDLTHATEVVLSTHNRVRPAIPARGRRGQHGRRPRGRLRGSASRAAAGALRIGNTVGAAMSNRRALGPAETGTLLLVAAATLLLAVVALMWPLVVAVPLSLLGLWVSTSLLVRTILLWRRRFRKAQRPLRNEAEP